MGLHVRVAALSHAEIQWLNSGREMNRLDIEGRMVLPSRRLRPHPYKCSTPLDDADNHPFQAANPCQSPYRTVRPDKQTFRVAKQVGRLLAHQSLWVLHAGIKNHRRPFVHGGFDDE
jgi:hypothetical protein